MATPPVTAFNARSTSEQVAAGHDLTGRTLIVTGANTGIGEAAASALCATGARVIFACRDTAAGNAAVARARILYPHAAAEAAELDLASFASIQRFVNTLEMSSIDALICNAGLSMVNFATTADGLERTVGVSHVGHFLLTRLLTPKLLASTASRVVMVSSHSHKLPAKLDFNRFPMSEKNFNGLTAYGQAKLCNVLMARSLNRRYGAQGLMACALHPGTLIATEIGRHSALVSGLIRLIRPFTKTRSQGAATTVWAVVHQPAADLAGEYLSDCQIARSSDEASDPQVADRVWALTEEWLARAGEFPGWA